MLIFILVIAAAGFLVYAVYTQYASTPADQGVFKRVMLSVSAAIASIAAAIATFFNSGVNP